MNRATTVVLLSLALLAGCRDETPPGPEVSGSPGSTGDARPRLTKFRPQAVRALAPGIRRNFFQQPTDGGAAADASSPAGAPVFQRSWSFDQGKVGEAPVELLLGTSAGKPGNWRVVADPGAPTAPNVLAQLDVDKLEGRLLTAVAPEPSLRDVRVSVRCKAVSGTVDQSCGVVARFQDVKNYYVARANALEKDVNLYVVKDGKRTLLGGKKGVASGGSWHEIRLEAKGEHFDLYWDGARVYGVDDKAIPGAGRVGVWTKADSVTHFDDLTVLAL